MTFPETSSPPLAPPALSTSSHQTVLYREVLDALRPRAGGYVVVDCTVNGGGHAYGLLESSAPDGRLVGLDADEGALAMAAERLAPFAGRFQLVNSNFRYLGTEAERLGVHEVDGVVFDLGLSSNQLERSGRGFSFREDEPLDMRFDASAESATAADLLNDLSETDLERLFREYGEEPRARRVARAVVERRQRAPLERTGDLLAAVTRALGPVRGRIHPATRVFQALRIAVNDELAALEDGLRAAVELLRPGGRLAVISFHSLEDRIVKWRFRAWAESETAPPVIQILTRKPLVPSPEEAHANPRARSAKLRVAERLPTPSTHSSSETRTRPAL